MFNPTCRQDQILSKKIMKYFNNHTNMKEGTRKLREAVLTQIVIRHVVIERLVTTVWSHLACGARILECARIEMHTLYRFRMVNVWTG